jgi:hypothetical protein
MRTENGEVSLCCKGCTDTESLRFWRVGAERVSSSCPGAAMASPPLSSPDFTRGYDLGYNRTSNGAVMDMTAQERTYDGP